MMVFLHSCGTKIPALYKGDPPLRSTEELFNALLNYQADSDWLVSRAKVKIETPEENTSGTVYLRVKKDSMVWMVFKKFSVEASRMLLTPDSLFIIYRLEKKFERGSIEDLEQQLKLKIDFKTVQEMILAKPLLPDSSQMSSVFEKPFHYRLSGVHNDIRVSFKINAFDLLVNEMVYTDKVDRSVIIRYGNYKIHTEKGKIPYLREYIFPLDEPKRAYFKFDFQSIEFEKPERTIFNIPSQYVEIH